MLLYHMEFNSIELLQSVQSSTTYQLTYQCQKIQYQCSNIINMDLQQMCGQCNISLISASHMDECDIIEFFITHGVLKNSTKCPHCGNDCALDRKGLCFRCQKSFIKNIKKRQRCNFFLSAKKGTYLERMKLNIQQLFRLVAIFVLLKPPR